MISSVFRVSHLAFFGGYVVTFLMCLLLMRRPPLDARAPSTSAPYSKDAAYGRYSRWLSKSGLRRSPLFADDVSYGENVSTEADFLRDRVNVLCVVFAKRRRKVKAIQDTWGPHCNEVKFFASASRLEASNIGIHVLDKPKSSWHLLCAVIAEVWRSSGDTLQWIVFAPEDLYVIPENLRLLVAPMDHKIPYYLGHAMTLWNKDYNIAQAGYVLSSEALKLIAQRFNSSEACVNSGKHWKNEDFYLGSFLGEFGVSPEDTRDSWKRGRFHGFNLNQLLFSHKLSPLGSYWKRSLYPVTEGRDCCSDTSVTFQGIEPDKVYQFYYLLYHVKIFSEGGILGNRPAPRPTGEPVWRQFLREEGLWDYPDREISPELFYRLSEKRAFKLKLP